MLVLKTSASCFLLSFHAGLDLVSEWKPSGNKAEAKMGIKWEPNQNHVEARAEHTTPPKVHRDARSGGLATWSSRSRAHEGVGRREAGWDPKPRFPLTLCSALGLENPKAIFQDRENHNATLKGEEHRFWVLFGLSLPLLVRLVMFFLGDFVPSVVASRRVPCAVGTRFWVSFMPSPGQGLAKKHTLV